MNEMMIVSIMMPLLGMWNYHVAAYGSDKRCDAMLHHFLDILPGN
jgi:hypothetical protein